MITQIIFCDNFKFFLSQRGDQKSYASVRMLEKITHVIYHITAEKQTSNTID